MISPLHNEAAHVERLLRSMARQTRPPDLWLAVDDGSTDRTLELLRGATRALPFMRVLSAPPQEICATADRLALGLEARAFNWALGQVQSEQFDYVGKLDGDIELVRDHYARLLQELEADPALGVVGCAIAEQRGSRWRLARTPPHFVHGAVKLYRRECLQAVGGIREQLGWDIVDEASARLHGFRTSSLQSLIAFHHRQSGSAQGRLRGHARAGRSAWVAHYPAPWIALRALRSAAKPPRGLSGFAFAYGYLRAAVRGVEQIDDDELRSFIRSELRRRLRRALGLHSQV